MTAVEPPVLQDVPSAWPPAVRQALAAAADRLGPRVLAPRLILAGADVHRRIDALGERVADPADAVAPAEVPPTAPDGVDRVATVVSVAGLVHHADLVRALRGLRRALTADGQLLLAEPVGVPGWRGLVAGSAGGRLAVARGLHLGRDVPGAVRAAGFLLTDLERITVPTAAWPLRRLVVGRAVVRHAPAPPEIPGGTPA